MVKEYNVGRKIGKGIEDLYKIINSDNTMPILYVRRCKENVVIITESEFARLKKIENGIGNGMLMEEFQHGRECERRSIVARLKNKFETFCGTIAFKEEFNGIYAVNLEDICNFILEGDK